MKFLKDSDLASYIHPDMLAMLTAEQAEKKETAENTAMGYIQGYLSERYNLASEFAKQGDSRNPTLLRWCISIFVYFIYNGTADTEIPERVDNNYHDACKEILAVTEGKRSADLERITTSGVSTTRFRWGSSPKRSHNAF